MKSLMKILQQLLMKKKTELNRELKESIRMMKTQRSDTEKNNFIEDGKRKGIDNIIR